LLTVALLTSDRPAADAIEQLLHESNAFELVFRECPIPTPHEVVRALITHNPEILLLDIAAWDSVSELVLEIKKLQIRTVTVGFRGGWDRAQKMAFEDAGIADLLSAPFSTEALEEVVYEGLHRDRPIANQNILAFLPAKAGGGCSTVALNTAGALGNEFGKKVLLIECDRRSGVFSIMLNVKHHKGLTDTLQDAATMTSLDWQQYRVELLGIHMVLANLNRRGPLLSWAQYYQLLRLVGPQYDFLIADLPEVVNAATAEVVKCARGVFVVCTPEVPSLKLAGQRCVELEECEIPAERIHIVLNRWERGQLKLTEIEKILGRPVFATVRNDYKRARQAILESGLIDRDSAIGKGCKLLAEKLGGLPEQAQRESKYSLLRKLAGIAE
jgi:pilus assembly protein CpaE